MKITKSQLKQIIKEELNEFGGVAGNLAAHRPALEPIDSTPDSEIQSHAMEFFMNFGIEQKVSRVLVKNIAVSDLIAIMEEVPKIDTADQEEEIVEKRGKQ